MKFNVNGELKIELPQIEYDKINKFIIFGIGEVGKKVYEKLSEKVGKESIFYIIDSAYPRNEYKEIPIIRPDNLDTINTNEYYYILGTLTNTNTMEKILIGAGVDKEKILVCTDIFSEEKVLEAKGNIKKICIYPTINDRTILEKQISKINWFLNPKRTEVLVYFVSEIENVPCYERINVVNNNNIKQIEFDIMLIWNYFEYSNINIKAREIYCIDDNFFSIIDLRMLVTLRYRLTDFYEKNLEKENSLRNFKKYVGKYKRALIVGSGKEVESGIKLYHAMQTNSDLKIVCNTAIFNDYLMQNINPNLYVISDEAFLTQEYKDVLDKIIDTILQKEFLFVVPIKWIPILKEKYNDKLLDERLVGIEVGNNDICFPTSNNLAVYRKAGNVVTRLAIPIGSAFCNEIFFIGCDGRPLNYDESGMWSYSEGLKNKTEQFFDQNFKKTVLGDLLDDEYYLVRHYEYMKELIEFGEKLGKKYFSLTKSYIPVLKERKL